LPSPSALIARSVLRFVRCLKRKLIGRSVWVLDGRHLIETHRHAAADLVADLADLLDALARGIWKLPIQVSLARVDGAGIAAAHGYDDVRFSHELIRQRLR